MAHLTGGSVRRFSAALEEDGVATTSSANNAIASAQFMEEGSSTLLGTAEEAPSSDNAGGDEDSLNSTRSWGVMVSNKIKKKSLMASGLLLLLGGGTRILVGGPRTGGAISPHGASERIEKVQVHTWQDGGATNGGESANSIPTQFLQPLKAAQHLVASGKVAPARAALGIQGLKDGLKNLEAPNLQGIWDMVSGEDDDIDYDCQEDVSTSMSWTPDKQRYCCNVAGVGCARQEDTSAMGGDDHPDTIDDLLEPGNSHVYKPLVGADGAFQSGVPLCDIGVDSCSKNWWTGPTGGFYCPEEAKDKQCRPLADGPWDPQECKSQCSIGNTPITTTITATSTTVTRTYPGMSIKLLCWSVCAQPYEIDIARFQMQRNAGIFDCDETMVLTFWPEVLDAGALGKLNTVVIPRENVGRSKDGTAGNALQFMKAWDAVAHDGRWNQVDWVLKVDPDAVLLPDRMRIHLNPYQGWKVYLRNCDKPMSEGAMMFGALEAISVPGLQVYFGAGGRCFHEIPWQAWGEDLFMMRCLEHLGVGPVGDFQLIQDGVCKGVWCGSNWAAAFHPMKSVWAWENCWHQAIASR